MRRVLRITSRQHPIVQRCRRLAARQRDDPAVLLDGEHLVAEALEARVPIEILLTDGRASEIATRALAAGTAVYACTAPVLAAASPVRTATGTVAIAEWRPASPKAIFVGAPALVLGLVDVQDPGNVGGVIRSADALGATAVVALDRTADPGGWKALRGAMGSTFRLPVGRGALAKLAADARRAGLRVAATGAEHGEAVESTDLQSPVLVLLGNEGAGLPASVIEQADLRLTVPMRAGVNSLNVAVTAALILYEARRQRRRASAAPP